MTKTTNGTIEAPGAGATAKTQSQRLAYRPRDAARMLSISERTLFQLTKNGVIPCVKVGRVKLYADADLRAWLTRRAATPNDADVAG